MTLTWGDIAALILCAVIGMLVGLLVYDSFRVIHRKFNHHGEKHQP